MRRRLKRAKIKFLSLVPRGANRLPTILKDDGAFEVELLTKAMTDNGELVAVVYAPEFRDSQGDIASASVIKNMAYDAAKHGVEIDVRHDNKPVGKDKAYVAESFIVQKADPRFDDLTDYQGKSVDPTGAWGVVIKIEDPQLRKRYQDGSWQGVSMGGVAEVEQEKSQDVADRVVNALAKKLGVIQPSHKETDMALTKDEIAEIAKAVGVGVVSALNKQDEAKAKAAEADAVKKAAEEKNSSNDSGGTIGEAPEFKGDPTSMEDVKKHQAALRKHKLLADVDWNDPEAVAKLQETLAAEASDDPKAAEIAKLEGQIAKLQGRSNQGQPPPPKTDIVGIDKQLQEAVAIGRAMAGYANTSRGHKS